MPVQLYTVDEAAQRLNTTTRFIRRLIAERRIAFTKVGRHVRIESDVLDDFIAAGRVEPDPGGPQLPSTRCFDRSIWPESGQNVR
ncbi:MAG TPA: helix-turn-helix domain-containing protein [Sporichthyaceae bacterium]|jgi:excisionase family DNA binding protein|nr:helix-turn-helix domain-containing protein [Sporichthyaceae bacterium]